MTTSAPMAESAERAASAPAIAAPPALTPSPGGDPQAAGTLDPKLTRLSMFLQAARDPQIDAAKLKELRAMAKEDDDAERKREFYTALADAKAEIPKISKTRTVDYAHKDRQGRTQYKYEELADITDVVMPILARHGITHSFRVDQSAAPKIKVKCVLAHANGYEVEGEWAEGVEDTSGQKSPNQAISSTVTFIERRSLKQALGLAAGRDDDGADHAPPFAMAADDIVYVEDLIRDTKSDLAIFLDTIGAPSIAELNNQQYKRAISLLNEKKRRAASGAKK